MHYCHMTKEQIWETTLPQLKYLMRQCGEHIEFTITVATMGLPSFLGGGTSAVSTPEEQEDGEYVDGYKVATADDMNDFAQLLGA